MTMLTYWPTTRPAVLPDIETVSAEVHQAWIETKMAQGIASRRAADGTEQMVPYAELPDALKELDRATVRAVYAAIQRCQTEKAPEVRSPNVTITTFGDGPQCGWFDK